MSSCPFSELVDGDKFILEENDSLIKVRTGPSNCRLTGEAYVGDGEAPEQNGEEGEDFNIDPKTSVIKLFSISEMMEHAQHEIWEAAIQSDQSVSEFMDGLLDDLIEQTANSDDEEDAIIHKAAVMMREERDNKKDETD